MRLTKNILVLFVIFVIFVISLSIFNCGTLGVPEPGKKYLDAVKIYYDNVIKYGRDVFGKTTPLFADGVDIEKKEGLTAPNGQIICNFAHQQYLLRNLVCLSDITGNKKYYQAAYDATEYFLENLVNKNSGLFYWGGHVYRELEGDTSSYSPHNSHELKSHYPYYEFLYEVNPDVTKRFIESFWKAHVDLKSEWWMYGRHANMDKIIPRTSKPGELAFMSTGSDLFYSAAFLYSKTNDKLWENRAVRLAGLFAGLNDQNTGLGPPILDVYDPTFDRRVTKMSLGHLGVQIRNLLPPEGRRSDSRALCQLYISEILSGNAAVKFRSWAISDLKSYAKHCWDEEEKGYFEMRRTDTGERLKFSDTKWFPASSSGRYWPPEKFRKNIGLPMVFFAFTRGYKYSKAETLKEGIQRCLNIFKIEKGEKCSLSELNNRQQKSDFAACLIHGLLELYEADNESWYIEAAQDIADDALARFFDGNFFVDWQGEFKQSRVDQSLPLALLRLYAVLNDKKVDIPQDILGYRPGGPRNVDGDLTVRFMWGKHYVDINGGNLSARVGDYFPHSGDKQTTFSYPGLWRLSSGFHPENVLNAEKGMIFEPLRRTMPGNIVKQNKQEAMIERWQSSDGLKPQKNRKYFGVRMYYKINDPQYIDYKIEFTPLEENYGDLSLRGVAYLNNEAASDFSFYDKNGFETLQITSNKNIIVKKQKSGKSEDFPQYKVPLFYSKIGNSILVFMFKPNASVELFSEISEYSEQIRGFIWNIQEAEKDKFYNLDVRIGLMPASDIDKIINDYDNWIAD